MTKSETRQLSQVYIDTSGSIILLYAHRGVASTILRSHLGPLPSNRERYKTERYKTMYIAKKYESLHNL